MLWRDSAGQPTTRGGRCGEGETCRDDETAGRMVGTSSPAVVEQRRGPTPSRRPYGSTRPEAKASGRRSAAGESRWEQPAQTVTVPEWTSHSTRAGPAGAPGRQNRNATADGGLLDGARGQWGAGRGVTRPLPGARPGQRRPTEAPVPLAARAPAAPARWADEVSGRGLRARGTRARPLLWRSPAGAAPAGVSSGPRHARLR